MTVNWISLGCEQNKTIEDVTLGFGKLWSTYLIIFGHFMDQTTNWLIEKKLNLNILSNILEKKCQFMFKMSVCIAFHYAFAPTKRHFVCGYCGLYVFGSWLSNRTASVTVFLWISLPICELCQKLWTFPFNDFPFIKGWLRPCRPSHPSV